MRRPDLRKQLEEMSAEQRAALLKRIAAERKPVEKRWFDEPICGLSEDATKRMKEEDNCMSLGHAESKWLRYAKQLHSMRRLKVPAFFRENVSPRELYKRLVAFCQANDLPEEIIFAVVPSLVNYIQTGLMTPIIFVGEKGCGKTTAVKLLMHEALGIPIEVVKVPGMAGGRGISGDNGSYKAADVGCVLKAQLKHNSLLVGFIFDEIDKPERSRGENLNNELLSLTDGSEEMIVDNFMETRIIGLRHCPVFFTANDLGQVDPILADRCKIIHYPRATVQRLQSIARKYSVKRLEQETYQMIDFDRGLLEKSIDRLARRNVTSLRKYQRLIEIVLDSAFQEAMRHEEGYRPRTTAAMFEHAEREIFGEERRRVGYNV